jgi:membrane protease YdiL (CAAX protease family)
MILSSFGLKKTRLPVAKLVFLVESALLAIGLLWMFVRKIPVFENIKVDKGSIILGIIMGGVVLASSGIFYLIDSFVFNLKMKNIIEKMIYPIFSKVTFPEIIMMAVMSGIAEEFFFRGILMKEFGIIIASVIFGALHTSSRDTWFMGFWSALAGVFFCILYLKTGNLFVPMLAHAVNNFVGVMFIRYVYTQNPPRIKDDEEKIDTDTVEIENAFPESPENPEDEMSIAPVEHEKSHQDVSEIIAENDEQAYEIQPAALEISPAEEKPEETPEAAPEAPPADAEKSGFITASVTIEPIHQVSSPVQLHNPDMVKDIIQTASTGENIKTGDDVSMSAEEKKQPEPKTTPTSQNDPADKKKKKKKKSNDRRADDTNDEGIGFVYKPQ